MKNLNLIRNVPNSMSESMAFKLQQNVEDALRKPCSLGTLSFFIKWCMLFNRTVLHFQVPSQISEGSVSLKPQNSLSKALCRYYLTMQ